jgi:2-haloacid dehalogenase
MIKALAFDVGGTIFNWHDSIVGQLTALGNRRGINADWASFGNQWRQAAAMLVIDSKTTDIPRGNMEGANRVTLDQTLKKFGISAFTDDDKEAICLFWHDIPAWPDVRDGMARLGQEYLLSSLTILSTAMMVRNSKRADINWDCIISCEMMDHYKFYPEAYQRGCQLLGCRPEEVMMVAAHYHDLEAAAKIGMRTAFLDRPKEFGSDDEMNAAAAAYGAFTAEIVANSLDELADSLER